MVDNGGLVGGRLDRLGQRRDAPPFERRYVRVDGTRHRVPNVSARVIRPLTSVSRFYAKLELLVRRGP